MKKPDFSAFMSRLKGVFRFGSKKGDESVDDFEDRYYDDTDPETEAEDYLTSETYEDYEEDEDLSVPPQQMEVPKPDSPPNVPYDNSDSAINHSAGTLPGGTSPKELKLDRLGQAKQSLREKLSSRIRPDTNGLKLKIANAFKRSRSNENNFRAIKEWWNKVGGEFLLQRPFSPEIRPTLHHAFLWFIFASVAVQGGKMLALFLKPNQQVSRPPVALSTGSSGTNLELDSIASNDIFGAKGDVRDETLTPKKPINENIICKTADRKSSLGLELLNTVVLKDSVKSIASVQTRGSRDFMNVREGDKIQNMAEVGKIDRLRLVLKNLSTGECEFIEGTEKEPPTRGASPIKVVSPSKGNQIIKQQQDTGIKNEGNRYTIKKSMRDEMLSNNMSEILTQARAVQIKRPDGTLAFKMTEIVPGSIYAKLNIQDGDVITGINGKSFNNLNEVMTLFSQVREIDNFQISMEREGMEQTLEYNFE